MEGGREVVQWKLNWLGEERRLILDNRNSINTGLRSSTDDCERKFTCFFTCTFSKLLKDVLFVKNLGSHLFCLSISYMPIPKVDFEVYFL